MFNSFICTLIWRNTPSISTLRDTNLWPDCTQLLVGYNLHQMLESVPLVEGQETQDHTAEEKITQNVPPPSNNAEVLLMIKNHIKRVLQNNGDTSFQIVNVNCFIFIEIFLKFLILKFLIC